MEIKQGKLFEHAFFINRTEGESQSDSRDKVDAMNNWCNENLNGQWILISGDLKPYASVNHIDLSYFSKAVHTVPVVEVNYPPAEVDLVPNWLFAFEREDDAAAFKLKWSE